MATLPPVANTGVKKLSFAKVVAASTSKETTSSNPVARSTAPTTERPGTKANTTTVAPSKTANKAAISSAPVIMTTETPRGVADGPAVASAGADVGEADKVVEGLKDLKLETKMPSVLVNGSGSTTTERSSKTGNSRTPSDDNSQRADSNSELGTKPPSLDGKSITSGTTFALDEKESLRPDDSASVKAAAEDDDTFSIRGSLIAGSRMGSDVAARIHRIQLGDMPPRAITSLAAPHSQGIATPQSGESEKQPIPDPKLPLPAGAAGPQGLDMSAFYQQNPDEKLLEAMQSSKDRYFLVRLEQQVIDFVQDSKEPFMDLPPSNSFCRMLTHKLADYYHMTHSFEPVPGAVRIYRTPFCRIPPRLTSLSVATPSSSSPAPAAMPFKIMRRGEDGELAPLSAGPSKPTSEVGSDSKEKSTTAKEKLTREEREEAYNRARERIFGSAEKTEATTPEGEDSAGVSRASSVSAKDKANAAGKRKLPKQRRDSESFDTRSSYMVINGPQQTWAPASQQYYHVNNPPSFSNVQYQQPYQNVLQPVYPNQPYPPMMPQNSGFVPPYNGMPQYAPQPVPPAMPPQPAPQQRYQPPTPPMPMSYSAPMPTAPQQQQPWQPPQTFSQNQYPPVARSNGSPPSGIPYAYGQLPANSNPRDPKSQHPIPGSYNRQTFNPKTQSFVPSGNMGRVLQPGPGPYGNSSPLNGSPQFNQANLNYGGYQPAPMVLPGGYDVNSNGYVMARQGSNNSMPPYQAAPQPPLGPSPPHTQPPPKHLPLNPNMGIPHKPAVVHTPPVQQPFNNHLPNYGNPASLPQKPPT